MSVRVHVCVSIIARTQDVHSLASGKQHLELELHAAHAKAAAAERDVKQVRARLTEANAMAAQFALSEARFAESEARMAELGARRKAGQSQPRNTCRVFFKSTFNVQLTTTISRSCVKRNT
jgi:hypothetical protein